MNTKILSARAISIIDQYAHFKISKAVCSIPYFNNKRLKTRAGLRVNIGKGSPKELFEETLDLLKRNHINPDSLDDASLKRFLTDNNLGIECSGFVYYILNAEGTETGKGQLDKRLSFVNCHGLIGKIRCSLRPIENCDVATFAHDKNSKIISIRDVSPGDFITMLRVDPDLGIDPIKPQPSDDMNLLADDQSSNQSVFRNTNHILIIHQIEYQNFVPVKMHYTHAIEYPEDGLYGSGIKQGVIEVTDPDQNIMDTIWIESGRRGSENMIFTKAKNSKTEIRRLLR